MNVSSPSLPVPSFCLKTPSETWDEGMPSGNGLLGSLLWGSPGRLNLSLDCTELWDTTPIAEFQSPDYRFSFIVRQVELGDIGPVQALIDRPYEIHARPTRLPSARMEFCFADETWEESGISYEPAVCWQRWQSGRIFHCWTAATRRLGFVEIEGPGPASLRMLNPHGQRDYERADGFNLAMPVSALGYEESRSRSGEDWWGYSQRCPEGQTYAVIFHWRQDAERWRGAWTVVSGETDPFDQGLAGLRQAMEEIESIRSEHQVWWAQYWQGSSLQLDDEVLTKSWHHTRYLFGSAARLNAPPITLQGPWTCDNGYLPPWKGDYHHDLNTQYCYYHAFSGNQMEGVRGFVDWLWSLKPACEDWTRRFFDCPGLNIPGVMDIKGNPLGGWHQYTHSPTIGGWLAHFFYLYWRYTLDETFLHEKAYPWLNACAVFLETHTRFDPQGKRCFPLSSSPEIHDNTLAAWFAQNATQYDLSILRQVFDMAAEVAGAAGHDEEAAHWRSLLAECPEIYHDAQHGLLLAPDRPLEESHRHHAHLMSIHPFESLTWRDGAGSQEIMNASLGHLDRLGTWEWTGFAWAWRAVMWACARQGERAAQDLHLFVRAFCSKNGFHLNGDQTGEGHCHWTYRPFTLEGNFMSALAVQYMMLQSSGGVLRIFPAIPPGVREASFRHLRAEGALLVSAVRTGGRTTCVTIESERGGLVKMENPFADGRFQVAGEGNLRTAEGNLEVLLRRGQTVTLEAA